MYSFSTIHSSPLRQIRVFATIMAMPSTIAIGPMARGKTTRPRTPIEITVAQP